MTRNHILDGGVGIFFLQMSGFPGSGKSTLARMIAKSTNGIVIDHDIVKTALLESMDTDLDPKHAGGISYHIEWSLIDFYLSQGHNVILDSPCLYDVMVNKGTSIAEKHGAKYKYAECILNDVHEINNRLKNRERMMSQIGSVELPQERFEEVVNRSKKPANYECLIVDTSQPIEDYINKVLAYIDN